MMFKNSWESAEATVVAERLLTHWSRSSGAVPHEYVVDVRPLDRAPFRATFHEPLLHGHYDHPGPGEVINVLFDPKSMEVKLAPGYEISPRKLGREKSDAFRAIGEAGPGEGLPQVGVAATGGAADPGSTVNRDGEVRLIQPQQ